MMSKRFCGGADFLKVINEYSCMASCTRASLLNTARIILLCKSQFQLKSVISFFVSVIMNTLTDLCGN